MGAVARSLGVPVPGWVRDAFRDCASSMGMSMSELFRSGLRRLAQELLVAEDQ